MVKLFGKTLLAGAGILFVAACGRPDAKVYERVSSPDGAMEAVLMLCPMESDPNVMLLTGAVFTSKGNDCATLRSEGRVGFQTSRNTESDDAAASVTWENGRAVFELQGDRNVTNRFAQSNVSLDLIQLKGSFDEADIVTED